MSKGQFRKPQRFRELMHFDICIVDHKAHSYVMETKLFWLVLIFNQSFISMRFIVYFSDLILIQCRVRNFSNLLLSRLYNYEILRNFECSTIYY